MLELFGFISAYIGVGILISAYGICSEKIDWFDTSDAAICTLLWPAVLFCILVGLLVVGLPSWLGKKCMEYRERKKET